MSDLADLITQEVQKRIQFDPEVIDNKIREAELAIETNFRNLKEELYKSVDSTLAEVRKQSSGKTELVVTQVKVDSTITSESVGIQHEKFPDLLRLLNLAIPAYLVGPTGSGKTIAVMNAGKALNLKVYRLVVSGQTQQHQIFGYCDANGRYVQGVAYEPFVNGGILFIDEIDNGNANTNVSIKMLQDTDECFFPNGIQQKHKDFRLVANANTVGNGANLQYVGRNQQDKALLNIFAFVFWDYDEEFEKQLAWIEYQKYGGTEKKKLDSIVSSFHQIRLAVNQLGLNHIMSPRNLFNAVRCFAQGIDGEKIRESLILRELDRQTVDKIKAKIKGSGNSSQVFNQNPTDI